jgi:hypothetical protein
MDQKRFFTESNLISLKGATGGAAIDQRAGISPPAGKVNVGILYGREKRDQ